jgi:hypothetical protein
MRCSSHPARLTRSRRAHLLAVALLLGVVLVAGCTGSSGSPGPAGAGPAAASGSAAAARPATAMVAGSAPASAVSGCPVQTIGQAPCYTPHQLLVAYGIQPVLGGGIDGRGETVTVLAPAPSPDTADITDIRQDLAAFNRMFGLPAARIQVVTTLAGSAAPWQAGSVRSRLGTSIALRDDRWPRLPRDIRRSVRWRR